MSERACEVLAGDQPLCDQAEKDRRFTAEELELIAFGNSRRPVYRVLKRAFDLCFSLCVLVMLLPARLLMALVVWLDDQLGDGPRVGSFIRNISLVPVITGTPNDRESAKVLSHSIEFLFDLHEYERRSEPFLDAKTRFVSFPFLTFADFGGFSADSGWSPCIFGVTSHKDIRAVA